MMGGFLWLSGICSLVYQMVWLKEFRLLFGASTTATAAVLAVFMGGLGFGALYWGKMVERSRRPLRFYALIELATAASVALTPVVLVVARWLYLSTGGVVTLGTQLAMVAHVVLTAVVLGLPCFLMGGNLPAAARFVCEENDSARGSTGLIYGLNALGALIGVVLGTFWLLEQLGLQMSLLAAVALNGCIGGLAWLASHREQETESIAAVEDDIQSSASPAPERGGLPFRLVLAGAFVSGFVFFLCELVWYRMLAPLTGSSTYGFGIVLMVALAGIGVGGVLYRWVFERRSRLVGPHAFAAITLLQALVVIAPFAMGDRIAVLAFYANEMRGMGFSGQILAWTLITAALVLLPAILSGVQFPLLVGLAGRGRSLVGRDLGATYAANTVGAISGSLLGGLILIPSLSAEGCWLIAAGLLVLAAAVALWFGREQNRCRWRVMGPALGLASLVVGLMVFTDGPTSVWRHTPIGYGRIEALPDTPAQQEAWMRLNRRRVEAEFEGRESSIAVVSSQGRAFYVNGKSDGSGMGDAPTQTMLGLTSAILHPHPRRSLVVGLGTGTTAGWMADIEGMERVDVVELEPAMGEVARDYFEPVNRGVMDKPNVNVIYWDAREVLLAGEERYDLIVSEPSNPYRAGISTLYTKEFYEATKERLAESGIFTQWLQSYEIDTQTVRTVAATVASVFPNVEVWSSQGSDLLFICHLSAPNYTREHLERTIAREPFASALEKVWHTHTVEGFLGHHLASDPVSRYIREQGETINTDDKNRLEYAFTRALMHGTRFSAFDLLKTAQIMKCDLPPHLAGSIDSSVFSRARLQLLAKDTDDFPISQELKGEDKRWATAVRATVARRYPEALSLWPREVSDDPFELLLRAECVSYAGTHEQAQPLAQALKDRWPVAVAFMNGHLAMRAGRHEEASQHLAAGFRRYQSDPWVPERLAASSLSLVRTLAKTEPGFASALFDMVREPFVLRQHDELRREALVAIAGKLPPSLQIEAVDQWGDSHPWSESFLAFRAGALVAAGDARGSSAQRDLEKRRAQEDRTFLEAMRSQ